MSTPSSSSAATTTQLFDARERTCIIEAARALYMSQGIAGVSMADIAYYLRMPEHAVQRWFPDTNQLIEAALEAQIVLIQSELGNFYRGGFTTAVEELLALRNWMANQLQSVRNPFYQQLEQKYPQVFQRWNDQIRHYSMTELHNNLHRGIQQGLYRANLDVEAQVAGWFAKLEKFFASATTDSNLTEQYNTMLNVFLAELVTPAGALVVRRLQEAAPYY